MAIGIQVVFDLCPTRTAGAVLGGGARPQAARTPERCQRDRESPGPAGIFLAVPGRRCENRVRLDLDVGGEYGPPSERRGRVDAAVERLLGRA
jgi:hypothetical protein